MRPPPVPMILNGRPPTERRTYRALAAFTKRQRSTWTDQGHIQGRAHDTLRYRRELGDEPRGGAGVRIFADVMVKHGVPAGDHDIRRVAEETFHRGGADGLIVTGAGTGKPTDLDDVRRVREAVPEAPVWIGSGITPARLPEARQVAQGAIIGTWLHQDARLDRPLDPERVAPPRRESGGRTFG